MSDKSLQKARAKAEKVGAANVHRHILMCYDKSETNCASSKQMAQSWKYLQQRLKQLGLGKNAGILRSKCNCFGICKAGPIVAIYPDGVWYGQATPDVLETIIDEHLVHGRVVEQYVIADNRERLKEPPERRRA